MQNPNASTESTHIAPRTIARHATCSRSCRWTSRKGWIDSGIGVPPTEITRR